MVPHLIDIQIEVGTQGCVAGVLILPQLVPLYIFRAGQAVDAGEVMLIVEFVAVGTAFSSIFFTDGCVSRFGDRAGEFRVGGGEGVW